MCGVQNWSSLKKFKDVPCSSVRDTAEKSLKKLKKKENISSFWWS